MRTKDINEGPISALKSAGKKFQQDVAKGFTRTQSGGSLAPDALQKGIKNFFTNVDPEVKDKSKDTDSKKKGGGAGTDSAMATAKDDLAKAKSDAGGALAIMAAKRKYSKELKGYDNQKADNDPPQDARLIGKDGNLYHWSGTKWLMYNTINGRYEQAPEQDAVKASWIDAAAKGKTTFIKKESEDKTMDKAIKEGLADLAGRAEADHEVQMARADLYKIAKYAIKLHDMLKGVSEEQGLEGWQQAKITKAADYIGSVYHNLDYDMKFGEGQVAEGKSPHKKGTKAYKKHMAAMHAGMKEDAYKSSLHAKLAEKAVSKDQQRAAGAALAAKRGDAPKSKLQGASKEMMKMSTKELEKFAGTKHKGLPEKKK